jgi:hypothetical protein
MADYKFLSTIVKKWLLEGVSNLEENKFNSILVQVNPECRLARAYDFIFFVSVTCSAAIDSLAVVIPHIGFLHTSPQYLPYMDSYNLRSSQSP